MRTFVELVISWAPMLLLIGVWIYFMRRSGGLKQGQYFEEVRNYLSDHIAETRRMNANLERIAAVLEARNTPAGPSPKSDG
jgi:ATP-dependent Zn protease